MKQEPTVSEKTSFRYLKEKDRNNPHFPIVCFFCDENHIESFRFGMIDLIKTAYFSESAPSVSGQTAPPELAAERDSECPTKYYQR